MKLKLRAHLVLIFLALASVLLHAQNNTTSPPPDWVVGDAFVGVGNGSYQVWHSTNPAASKPTYTLVNTITDISATGRTAGCGFDLAYRFFGTNFDESLVDRYAIDNEHAVQQTLNGPSINSQSVAFDGTGNVFIGYDGGVSPDHKGTIQQWTKDTTVGSPTFGQYKLAQTFSNVPVDNTHGPGWIDLAKDGHTIFYTSQGPNIRTFDTTAPPNLAAGIYATVSATLFALRILPPGDGSGGVLVAAQGNVLLVNGASVTKFNVFGNDNNLQALSLDSSGTRAWAGDASNNDFTLFDYASGKKIASFKTGTGSAAPLGGICVDGSYSRAEVANLNQQTAPPFNLTPGSNTVTFTSPLGTVFTDTFADLKSNLTATLRYSLVDSSLALSDPAMLSFNPGNPITTGTPLPGNMICDTTLTAATGHPGKCELFELEANPNSGYTVANIQIEPPANVGRPPNNLRLVRNLDEDITDNVDCCSGTTRTKSVYTTNQQISNSGFEVCSGNTFQSPASGPLNKNQTSTITFKFQVAPTGTCPSGASNSPLACASTLPSGPPCLSPLLMVVQLQPGGAAPVRVPVHVAGNSGGLPLFVLTGNTWQLQVKTDNMPAGFTYVATMVDLGAGIITGGVQFPGGGQPTTSSVTIPSVFAVFTLN